MAPGVNITSAIPGGGYKRLSGTSFATPFVTGTVALLSSIFKRVSAPQLVRSVRLEIWRRGIFPPLCDAQNSQVLLQSIV